MRMAAGLLLSQGVAQLENTISSSGGCQRFKTAREDGGQGVTAQCTQACLWGRWKCLGTWTEVLVAQHPECIILNATELFASNWLILCEFHFNVFLKRLKLEGEKNIQG